MKITSLTLIGCRRLSLNNHTTFILNSTEKIQLILGTNGCGKSSVIDLLTPLPANAKDFTKEGRKEITIEKGHDHYVISSVFSPSTKHSFKKNGEELNPGGTSTVQSKIAEQEFNITSQTHDLIVNGREKFTTMSPARRREWFTKLNANYDYALKVYADLKVKHRDYNGALKIAKKRLVTEAGKIISTEEEKQLTEEVELILNELTLLMENRIPVLSLQHSQSLEARYKSDMDELGRMSMKLLKIKCLAPYGYHPDKPEYRDEWHVLHRAEFNSIAEIETVIDKIRQQISAKDALVNHAMVKFKKLKETIDLVKKAGAEGLGSIDEQIKEYEVQRQQLLSSCAMLLPKIEGITAKELRNIVLSTYEFLNELLMELPSNPLLTNQEEPYRQYGNRSMTLYEEQLFKMKNELTALTHFIDKVRVRKAHYEEHKNSGQTTCPKCEHRWVIGYSEEGYQKACIVFEEKEIEKKALQKQIQDTEALIQKNQQYTRNYRSVHHAFRSNLALQDIWAHIEDKKLLMDTPKEILNVLQHYAECLELEYEADGITVKINELLRIKNATEQQEVANMGELISQCDEEEKQVSLLSHEIAMLQKTLQEHQNYRQQLLEATQLGQQITELKNNLDQMNLEMIEDLRRNTIAHCIKQLQLSLATKQQVLTNIHMQKALIEDLENNIALLTLQEDTAKLLIQELSPTDGIIAEGLLGFIRIFVAKMNSLISKLWSYPLQIMDCGVASEDGAELDYKFKIMVNHKDNIKDDVQQGSEGMQELFDLVFRIVAMEYLGLQDHPLCLDEFGRTFDPVHRTMASTITKTLMEQKNFSQLYMISHYESMFGAFTNAQMCVLCDNNIVVPSGVKYNTHVTLY